MSGFINFIKGLFGKESFEDGIIGLAKFEYQDVNVYDKAPTKKKTKSEPTLSQMLRRS